MTVLSCQFSVRSQKWSERVTVVDSVRCLGSGCIDRLDEAGEHSSYFRDACFQNWELFGRKDPQVPSKQQVVIKFARRTNGYIQELPQFAVGSSATSFGYICGNGKGCPPHLTRNSKGFAFGEHGSYVVDAQGECVGFLPHVQFGVVLHHRAPSCSSQFTEN